MSYKTTILYIVMGGAQNTTAQRALLKQSAADLRLPIHAVMMGDEGDHRPVVFASSEASGVDGAVVMTAHAPSAARLIANGCPTIYCHNEAIWADSAPWRIIVRSGEEIPAALAENPRPLPPKPIQVQPKVAVVPPIAFAYPSNVVEAKKPKRGRALPKKQSYPHRDENGNLWVSAVKKLSPRFIFLYKDVARRVSLFTADGMTMEKISEKLGRGGFKVSATTVWVIQQGIKAGAWPHLK